MFAPGQVEDMLRAHLGSYCSIQLFKELGGSGWSAAINHYDPAKVSLPETVMRGDDDPVVALGKALIEDARLLAYRERRYAAAPKVGAVEQQIDIKDAIAVAVSADDVMDLLG